MAELATIPLTGKALLQKVKELSNVPRRETARACGYFTTTKENKTRVNLADFYDAILAAKGVAIEAAKDGRGREASYRVSVHQNGQIVIGANYTSELGLTPGDEFEIKLGYKHIRLVKVENSEFESESMVS
ncbi:MAG: AbrB family transcriptional regulator [Crinalium sp.]